MGGSTDGETITKLKEEERWKVEGEGAHRIKLHVVTLVGHEIEGGARRAICRDRAHWTDDCSNWLNTISRACQPRMPEIH